MIKRIELIEFLKGFSILTIVIFHYLQTFHWQNIAGKLIFFGGTGVHLFIFLSGFGLYYSYLHKPVTFPEFLKKRISKVYIPYLIIVIVSALFACLIPVYEGSWYAFGGHVFLYKMFDESIIGSYGYPLWFISLIIQFYLMFYSFLWVIKKIEMKNFLYLSFLLSFIWVIYIIFSDKDVYRIWNSFFLKYLWEFSLGMYTALKYKEQNYSLKLRLKPATMLIIGVFSCILYAILALKVGIIGKMVNDIPALAGYTLIAVWIYYLKLNLVNRFVLYIGKISYSLYLVHTLVIMMISYFLTDLWHPIIILISFIISIYFAKLYSDFYNKTEYKFFNYPFNKLL